MSKSVLFISSLILVLAGCVGEISSPDPGPKNPPEHILNPSLKADGGSFSPQSDAEPSPPAKKPPGYGQPCDEQIGCSYQHSFCSKKTGGYCTHICHFGCGVKWPKTNAMCLQMPPDPPQGVTGYDYCAFFWKKVWINGGRVEIFNCPPGLIRDNQGKQYSQGGFPKFTGYLCKAP